MPPIVVVVAQFGICAAAIVFAGVRLSRYGDVIAGKSGAGGTAVGLTLLASVTSLPELVSGASAILLFDVADLASATPSGSSVAMVALYALAMRTIIRLERIRLEARLVQIAEELRHRHTPMLRAVTLFLLNAARLGAIDMAAGNLFETILFNVTLLAFHDLLYVHGPLASAVSASHLTRILGAIVMTGIVIVGFTLRADAKRYRLSWDAIAMVTVTC